MLSLACYFFIYLSIPTYQACYLLFYLYLSIYISVFLPVYSVSSGPINIPILIIVIYVFSDESAYLDRVSLCLCPSFCLSIFLSPSFICHVYSTCLLFVFSSCLNLLPLSINLFIYLSIGLPFSSTSI